ncbi:hypothetical protein SB861_32995 [Paraburkholderia sp. SIMBA_049]
MHCDRLTHCRKQICVTLFTIERYRLQQWHEVFERHAGSLQKKACKHIGVLFGGFSFSKAKIDRYKYQKLFEVKSSHRYIRHFLAGELFVPQAPGVMPGGASHDAVFPSALR